MPLFSTRGGKNLPKDNEGDTERGKNVETARKNGKKVWLSSASVPSVRGTRQLTPSSCDEGKHESNSTQGEEKCTEMYEKKGTIQTERGKNINLQLIITSADNTLRCSTDIGRLYNYSDKRIPTLIYRVVLGYVTKKSRVRKHIICS